MLGINNMRDRSGDSYCIIAELDLVDMPDRRVRAMTSELGRKELVPGGIATYGSSFVNVKDNWRAKVNAKPRVTTHKKNKGNYKGLPGIPG